MRGARSHFMQETPPLRMSHGCIWASTCFIDKCFNSNSSRMKVLLHNEAGAQPRIRIDGESGISGGGSWASQITS